MSEVDNRPQWMRSLRNHIGRPLPAERDTFAEAQEQMRELRAYAAEAAEALRGAQAIILENESLRREVAAVRSQMGEQVATLTRENRMLSAYATNLRTRLTAIREAIQSTENEALQFASNQVRERAPEPTDEERAALHQLADGIARANINKPDPPAPREAPKMPDYVPRSIPRMPPAPRPRNLDELRGSFDGIHDGDGEFDDEDATPATREALRAAWP